MSQRYFANDRLIVDGKYLRAYRIQCSLCHKTEKVQMNTSQASGAGHDDEILQRRTQRKFEDLGWTVGKRDREDLCSDCRLDKRKPGAPSKSTLLATATPTPIIDITPPTPDPQPAPLHKPKSNGSIAPLTREDRRIIYAKLEDVYESETTGYMEGWSDDRVARELALQIDWVATVRKENFGEWKDNPTLRLLIEETQQAIGESKVVTALVQSQFSELQQQLDRLKGSLAEAQRAAQRVLNIEQRLRALQNK